MSRNLFVGDIVITKVDDLLGNKGGTKGVVYEKYDLGKGPGASIIFENGEYDGFSVDEQEKMVMKIGHDDYCAGYIFDNVMTLSRDFRDGVFNSAFN